MPKKLTIEFVREELSKKKIKLLSKVYQNSSTKLECECEICNHVWHVKFNDIQQDSGCPNCYLKSLSKKKMLSIESIKQLCIDNDLEFKDEEYYGAKYLHTVECKKCKTVQKKRINNIRQGEKCKVCSIKSRTIKLKSNTKKFIEKAKLIHGDNYDYSLSIYIDAFTKVEIICKEHGSFWQAPSNHLSNHGCPICGCNVRNEKNRKGKEQFIFEAINIHKNNEGLPKYDYKLVEYINKDTKVKIICPIHGVFEQTPHSHLDKQGCPECGRIKSGNKLKKPIEQFIEEVREIHGNTYDYGLVKYMGDSTKIEIICKEHGSFWQTPNTHLKGCGCQKCANSNISKPEIDWLDKQNIPEQNRQTTIIINEKLFKVDGFIPETNTIYEFLGDFWHGNPEVFIQTDINPRNKKTYGQLYQETLDRIKTFEDNGYNVVYIWENHYNKQLKEEKLKNTNIDIELKVA